MAWEKHVAHHCWPLRKMLVAWLPCWPLASILSVTEQEQASRWRPVSYVTFFCAYLPGVGDSKCNKVLGQKTGNGITIFGMTAKSASIFLAWQDYSKFLFTLGKSRDPESCSCAFAFEKLFRRVQILLWMALHSIVSRMSPVHQSNESKQTSFIDTC